MKKKESNAVLNDNLYNSVLELLQNTNSIIHNGQDVAMLLQKFKEKLSNGEYSDMDSILDLAEKFLAGDGIPNEIKNIIHSIRDIQGRQPKKLK